MRGVRTGLDGPAFRHGLALGGVAALTAAVGYFVSAFAVVASAVVAGFWIATGCVFGPLLWVWSVVGLRMRDRGTKRFASFMNGFALVWSISGAAAAYAILMLRVRPLFWLFDG